MRPSARGEGSTRQAGLGIALVAMILALPVGAQLSRGLGTSADRGSREQAAGFDINFVVLQSLRVDDY